MIITKQKFTSFILLNCVFCLFILPAVSHAQEFDKGLAYYQQKNYRRALTAFNKEHTPRGYLFSAKSLYALGQYEQAQANLNNITSDAPPRLIAEADYTAGLVQFQQKNFGRSLTYLHQVMRADEGDLAKNAKTIYRQILDYLTARQRQQAIKTVSSDEIGFDLFKSGLGRIKFVQAIEVYKTFQDEAKAKKWKSKAHRLKSSFRNVSEYHQKYGASEPLQPPEGTVYTVGLALPQYNRNNRNYKIVQALYLGALLAVQNFNDNNDRAKARLTFVNTGAGLVDTSIKEAVKSFSKHQGDVLIGPLYSQQAESMISLANQFQIPSIAPLANAEIDNPDDSFFFQANPTFGMHGRQMADYAVKKLNLENIAIIADKNSRGAASARAFQKEAGRLGANISYFLSDNYASNNILLSQSLQNIIDDPQSTEAVYAPFTGSGARRLIDFLVNDLQAVGKIPVILGSQEYQSLNFHERKYQGVQFYFSEGAYDGESGRRLANFKNRYIRKFGHPGNHYSLIGYDITSFILRSLSRVGNPALLKKALSGKAIYRGLTQDIKFNGQNVNEAVKILKNRPGGNLSVVH